jgi:tRNA(Ile)-lysidine synthase
MADAFAHDFAHVEAEALVFDRMLMRTLTRPMLRRTVRSAIIATYPEASRLEFEHTEAIVDGLGYDDFARDLPFGLRAEAEYGILRVYRKQDDPGSVTPGLLRLPGELDAGVSGVLRARLVNATEPAEGPDRVWIDADSVTWPLQVDAVRDGDRIRPFGMEGTKKVGDLLTDAKVPRRLRGLTPIVRDGDRVVWVAGVRLADDVRVTPATVRVAELVWRRPEAGTNPLTV